MDNADHALVYLTAVLALATTIAAIAAAVTAFLAKRSADLARLEFDLSRRPVVSVEWSVKDLWRAKDNSSYCRLNMEGRIVEANGTPSIVHHVDIRTFATEVAGHPFTAKKRDFPWASGSLLLGERQYVAIDAYREGPLLDVVVPMEPRHMVAAVLTRVEFSAVHRPNRRERIRAVANVYRTASSDGREKIEVQNYPPEPDGNDVDRTKQPNSILGLR